MLGKRNSALKLSLLEPDKIRFKMCEFYSCSNVECWYLMKIERQKVLSIYNTSLKGNK